MDNAPGVEVRVPYFGSTTGVTYLDPSLYHPGEYFADMVDAFITLGLKEGVSLRAAPFDFRYAPSKFLWSSRYSCIECFVACIGILIYNSL